MPHGFDGSQRLFRIGARPLDPADWLLGGPDLAAALAEKARLFAQQRDAVFMAEAGSLAAQREVLDLIRAHLGQVAEGYNQPAIDEPPLLTAARLVAEDLLLLFRDETGWRLGAAALAPLRSGIETRMEVRPCSSMAAWWICQWCCKRGGCCRAFRSNAVRISRRCVRAPRRGP